MKTIYKTLTVFTLLCFSKIAIAQQDTEMADGMRANGKIYVVVAIMVIILVGILAYLFVIDRKVSRLEKRFGEKK